jgi:flagellar biosynthesis protein FlhB
MQEALFWTVVVIVIILLPLAMASMIVERHGDFLKPPKMRKTRIKRYHNY